MELTKPGKASHGALPALPTEERTVDVVLCCYTDSRWTDLLGALRSAASQGESVRHVIAVVDHNPALADRLAKQCLEGVNVIESRYSPGLSGARNTGVEAATSGIVLFLDDDALGDPDLASVLAERIAEPGVMGAFGAIRPSWDGKRPDWFPSEFLWALGCTYEGLRPGRVRNVLGAAMAIRRDVLLASGLFDTGLGRTAASLPMGCEETALCIRASKLHPDGVFVYDGRTGCDHRIPAGRSSLRYLLRRCWAEGLSKAALSGRVGKGAALASERAYLTRTIPAGIGANLADFVWKGRVSGLLRILAIIGGLVSAGCGYVFGWLRGLLDKPHAMTPEVAGKTAP